MTWQKIYSQCQEIIAAAKEGPENQNYLIRRAGGTVLLDFKPLDTKNFTSMIIFSSEIRRGLSPGRQIELQLFSQRSAEKFQQDKEV